MTTPEERANFTYKTLPTEERRLIDAALTRLTELGHTIHYRDGGVSISGNPEDAFAEEVKLHQHGINFDTGYFFGDGGWRDWELDDVELGQLEQRQRRD